MDLQQNGTITSRQISEITGKRHSDVLNAIRKMETAWEKVNGRKFSLVEYIDEKGQKRPEFSLMKTETLFVATKFNDEARAKLICRWETLENEKQFKPLSQLEIMAQSTQILIEQDKRIGTLENKVNIMEAKTTHRPDYFSVVGYAVLNKITIGLHLAANIGRKASSVCKTKGFPTDEVPDPRFGKVKLYPKSVLEQVFSEVVF